MNESQPSFKGVRQLANGNYVSSLLVAGHHLRGAERLTPVEAAKDLDIARFYLERTGHLKFVTAWNFPDMVAEWRANPDLVEHPDSTVTNFCRDHAPRYAPSSRRHVSSPNERRVAKPKLLAARETLLALHVTHATTMSPEDRNALSKTASILLSLLA